LVTLKIQSLGYAPSYAVLGSTLGMSASQAHTATRRAIDSGLLTEDVSVRPKALLETVASLKYFLPPKASGICRGIPTAYAAPPLSALIVPSTDPPPIWADADGDVRGIAYEPIYKTVPYAVKSDATLYEYLALIDALRFGRAREVSLATDELRKRLCGRRSD